MVHGQSEALGYCYLAYVEDLIFFLVDERSPT